jgi:hyperosmotically inducible protein
MKTLIGTFVCAAALIVAAPPPVQAGSRGTTAQSAGSLDAKITDRINTDTSLKKHDIKVSVDNDVVTLSGSVSSNAERLRAETLAKAAGATRVDNQIVVGPGAKGTAGKLEDKTKAGAAKTKDGAEKVWDKTKEGTEKAADKTGEGVKAGAGKTGDGAKKAGAEVTDGFISTTIKTRFMGDEALRGSDIKVDTDHHVVNLTGTVVSAAARAKAIEIAKSTTGVDRVVDHLTIKP